MNKPSVNAGYGSHCDDLPQQYFRFDRVSGLKYGYFNAPPAIDVFHVLVGVLIGFGLVTLLFFATHIR